MDREGLDEFGAGIDNSGIEDNCFDKLAELSSVSAFMEVIDGS